MLTYLSSPKNQADAKIHSLQKQTNNSSVQKFTTWPLKTTSETYNFTGKYIFLYFLIT